MKFNKGDRVRIEATVTHPNDTSLDLVQIHPDGFPEGVRHQVLPERLTLVKAAEPEFEVGTSFPVYTPLGIRDAALSVFVLSKNGWYIVYTYDSAKPEKVTDGGIFDSWLKKSMEIYREKLKAEDQS